MALEQGGNKVPKKAKKPYASKKSVTKNVDTDEGRNDNSEVVDDGNNMKVETVSAEETANKINRNSIFGILGSGKLAGVISKRLANSNIETVIFDKKIDQCLEDSKLSTEVKKFAESSDIILSCYDIPDQLNSAVCLGAIRYLTAHKGFVQMSLINPDHSVDFYEQCQKNNVKYLEAIIVSNVYNVDGKMTIISCGNKELYDDCSKCFNLLTEGKFYKGTEVGKGCKLATICTCQSITGMMCLLQIISYFAKSDQGLSLEEFIKSFSSGHFCDENVKAAVEKYFDPDAKFGITLGELVYRANIFEEINEPGFGVLTSAATTKLIQIVNQYGIKNEDIAYLFRNTHII